MFRCIAASPGVECVLVLGMLLGSTVCEAQPPAVHFTMAQVLSYPFPSDLVSLRSGKAFAWVSDAGGLRNIWLAEAPDYRARRVTNYASDTGQEITNLHFSPDGRYLVYVRGGDHDANWPETVAPDPTASPQQRQMQVWAVPLTGGSPRALGAGDTPAVSPDGRSVAFIHLPEGSVWIVPTDGSKKAERLFFELGRDSDLHWSPDGKALAFVSDRGDHSFIGVYRDPRTPVEYLLPSTSRDLEPRWSPDGTSIAFVRIPGVGGPPQPVAQWYPHPIPWSLWVADVRSNLGTRVWRSPDTVRGAYNPNVDLWWAAGNRLVFLSEMDNWPHLYAVPAAGGKALRLTAGNFAVEDVSVTPDGHTLIYSANAGSTPGDDDRLHLFRVSVDGGKPVAILRGDHSTWTPVLTADGRTLAFIDAGPRRPPAVMWGSVTGANWQSAGGDALPTDFPTNRLVVPRLVNFRAPDGWRIQGQLFRAGGESAPHDQSQRPGIIFVHGGPSRQMLLTWHPMDPYAGSYALNQYLANHGFVVLSVNYRLSSGYGHDFQHSQHSGPAGAADYQDVVAGAMWLQHYPGVDPSRIGIWGGSYGGYLTALALARNSAIFKAGVDMKGVHDWSLRTEYRLADTPAEKKTAWLSSPDSAVAAWRSPVLLIQGDDDRNVDFHQMVDLVRRLQLQHVPYQEIVIPDEIHGFLLFQSRLREYEATAEFFDEELSRTP